MFWRFVDKSVPLDVKEKILRFVKAGLAVAMMRGKSYLSCGTSAMGIAGSFVDVPFFQSYLGMRPENMDMCEIERRIAEGIYDKDEFIFLAQSRRGFREKNCIHWLFDNGETPSLRSGNSPHGTGVQRIALG